MSILDDNFEDRCERIAIEDLLRIDIENWEDTQQIPALVLAWCDTLQLCFDKKDNKSLVDALNLYKSIPIIISYSVRETENLSYYDRSKYYIIHCTLKGHKKLEMDNDVLNEWIKHWTTNNLSCPSLEISWNLRLDFHQMLKAIFYIYTKWGTNRIGFEFREGYSVMSPDTSIIQISSKYRLFRKAINALLKKELN